MVEKFWNTDQKKSSQSFDVAFTFIYGKKIDVIPEPVQGKNKLFWEIQTAVPDALCRYSYCLRIE